MFGSYLEIALTELLDVALVALLLWSLIVWLRRTRARLALVGVGILGGVYLLARQLGLQLTAWLLQGFFAVFLIVLVVVFQEDLRRLFEQIAVWGLRRRPPTAPPDAVDVLVRSAVRLAASQTGALIVVPGREPLERHVEGGIVLDGRISEPLLCSLFDAHSPGHDGAAILSGDRISRFAVHLPLSSERTQLGAAGTRHAAALGLAERTDALCIVVSEERGSVSVAHHGRLRRLRRPEQLAQELRRFLEESGPAPGPEAPAWRRLVGRWPEALIAAAAAAGVWLLIVPGSTLTEVARAAPVVVQNLPAGYVLEGVDPPEVEVVLSGRRRDLFFRERGSLEVRLDALLVKLGRRTFEISPAEIRSPLGTSVVEIDPPRVRLTVRQQPGAAAAEGAGNGPGATPR